ncbi:uncharacterized protein LOC120843038 [Ixodes scapularis]|uniref:uncharacterized protein LOC120843038 n=1 Tax=Ixodes scapularis TaxID=6945 RepID=UPI001A9DE241|nr:uncharacterized protein LOC120843038 [Ixodes scapularis]
MIQMSIFMIMMALATSFHGVESTCGNWYLDKDLSHMREECKTKLQSEFVSECKRIGAEFTEFNVCNIECQEKKNSQVKSQYVFLNDGLPCGQYGEKCKEGSCHGPCNVQFFSPPKARSDEEINQKKTDAK